ncbi:MAG: hypothetical protein KGR18_09365 [Acidobacteria bacterium]|nr:hypothetical protein [Acidobacteriota bacterium]
MGDPLSRRSVLAGLGAAGILVAAAELPVATSAGASSPPVPAPPQILLSRLRTRRLHDDDGCTVGHVTTGSVVDAADAPIGSFTATELGGGMLVHEFIVGESMMLGMGSGSRFAVVGAVGVFAGLTGGYVVTTEPDLSGTTASGRVRFI